LAQRVPLPSSIGTNGTNGPWVHTGYDMVLSHQLPSTNPVVRYRIGLPAGSAPRGQADPCTDAAHGQAITLTCR
jgi:hypothetical protein